MREICRRVVCLVLLIGLVASAATAADLSPELKKSLSDSKYVYISSKRKDASFSKPAEIWFMYHNGAVYVGTLPTSWRAKRIKWGRPQAKIAVGKVDGPSFEATGLIVKDPDAEKVMLETYAKKYPDGWDKFADKFRNGFKDGSRVLIRYAPK
ncbi:MAG: hypothetical protein HY270_09850 [Deltaproteobacteria bacterium]|nr:hypothetical protein [Deltaproteobacteria bacterium]